MYTYVKLNNMYMIFIFLGGGNDWYGYPLCRVFFYFYSGLNLIVLHALLDLNTLHGYAVTTYVSL